MIKNDLAPEYYTDIPSLKGEYLALEGEYLSVQANSKYIAFITGENSEDCRTITTENFSQLVSDLNNKKIIFTEDYLEKELTLAKLSQKIKKLHEMLEEQNVAFVTIRDFSRGIVAELVSVKQIRNSLDAELVSVKQIHNNLEIENATLKEKLSFYKDVEEESIAIKDGSMQENIW